MSDPDARGGMSAARSADFLRTVVALLVSGALGPVLFIAVELFLVALAGERLSLSSSDPLNEAIGLFGLVLILGCPASIGAAFLVGLPCIYLARRLRLTSAWIFTLGGAGLALACTAWFARGDVKGVAEWMLFAATMAVTGACCGLICWWIAEYPTLRSTMLNAMSIEGEILRRGQ